MTELVGKNLKYREPPKWYKEWGENIPTIVVEEEIGGLMSSIVRVYRARVGDEIVALRVFNVRKGTRNRRELLEGFRQEEVACNAIARASIELGLPYLTVPYTRYIGQEVNYTLEGCIETGEVVIQEFIEGESWNDVIRRYGGIHMVGKVESDVNPIPIKTLRNFIEGFMVNLLACRHINVFPSMIDRSGEEYFVDADRRVIALDWNTFVTLNGVPVKHKFPWALQELKLTEGVILQKLATITCGLRNTVTINVFIEGMERIIPRAAYGLKIFLLRCYMDDEGGGFASFKEAAYFFYRTPDSTLSEYEALKRRYLGFWEERSTTRSFIQEKRRKLVEKANSLLGGIKFSDFAEVLFVSSRIQYSREVVSRITDGRVNLILNRAIDFWSRIVYYPLPVDNPNAYEQGKQVRNHIHELTSQKGVDLSDYLLSVISGEHFEPFDQIFELIGEWLVDQRYIELNELNDYREFFKSQFDTI